MPRMASALLSIRGADYGRWAPYKLPERSDNKTLPFTFWSSMRVPASSFSLWQARRPLAPMTVRPIGGGDAGSTPVAHDMKVHGRGRTQLEVSVERAGIGGRDEQQAEMADRYRGRCPLCWESSPPPPSAVRAEGSTKRSLAIGRHWRTPCIRISTGSS